MPAPSLSFSALRSRPCFLRSPQLYLREAPACLFPLLFLPSKDCITRLLHWSRRLTLPPSQPSPASRKSSVSTPGRHQLTSRGAPWFGDQDLSPGPSTPPPSGAQTHFTPAPVSKPYLPGQSFWCSEKGVPNLLRDPPPTPPPLVYLNLSVTSLLQLVVRRERKVGN